MRKQFISTVLTLILTLFTLVSSFYGATTPKDTESVPSQVLKNAGFCTETGVIASEDMLVPVHLNLDELEQMKSELAAYGIQYTVTGTKSIVYVNVSTKIHYVNELYFSVTAQCSEVLLQRITGSIGWRYKNPSSNIYTRVRTISVAYEDDFGIPKYTLLCLKYTGNQFDTGTKISADFNLDVDATGEISGGAVSRTVTGTVP